jgi:hypothetical protein
LASPAPEAASSAAGHGWPRLASDLAGAALGEVELRADLLHGIPAAKG